MSVEHEMDWEKILKQAKEEFEEKYDKKNYSSLNLEDFELNRTLGTGAFGRVMLVKFKKDSKYYAMKMLDKKNIVKLKQTEHLKNEKNILAAVNFPFVISMDYYFHNFDYVFFVMKFVSGGELFSHLRRFKKFEEEQTKFFAAQVILAFEYLHSLGIVYRDLKPENILVTNTGYLKVTDLGFCKRINGRTWTLCGTPEYLAPEVILSKGYGFSVDWWSLGVLIFEMAAGHPPFQSRENLKLFEKIVAGKYKTPPHFSKEIKDILQNILQIDITRRYGNLKNGVEDIKKHEFFKNTDWIALFNQKLKPVFIPKTKDDGDSSNFEEFPEEDMRKSSRELYPEEFADF